MATDKTFRVAYILIAGKAYIMAGFASTKLEGYNIAKEVITQATGITREQLNIEVVEVMLNYTIYVN